MGNHVRTTLEKCLFGIANDILKGKPLSPSTQENCAVAEREMRNARKNSPAPSGVQAKTGKAFKTQKPKHPVQIPKAHFQQPRVFEYSVKPFGELIKKLEKTQHLFRKISTQEIPLELRKQLLELYKRR